MTVKDELKQLLKELKTHEDTTRVKAKAAELLKKVDAKTLSLAEQELLQEGFSQEGLRDLCGVHLEVLGGVLEEQRPEMDITHPIGILMEEHKIILRNLDELREIAEGVEKAKGFGEFADQFEHLKEITHLLLDTESHHQREEQSIFPRLERQGVSGPPQIMRLEHEDLRARKRKLGEFVEQAGETSFTKFAQEVGEVGGYIATVLRDHIFKEDNILYPIALQVIAPGEWSQVRQEFDDIGYCCFTPGVSQSEHHH